MFFILKKINNSNKATFYITIEKISYNNESNKYINESDYYHCNSIDNSRCGKCEDNICTLIQCGKETINFTEDITKFEIFNEICIPRNISNEEKKNICLNFNEANSYKVFNECNIDFEYNVISFISGSFLLLIIFIVFGTSLTIIYYNKYIINKKKMPFNIKYKLLQICFPNINEDSLNYQTMKNDENNTGANNYFIKYNNI